MNKCVFCIIARREKSANIVWEDDYVMAFLDIDPISDGHTLVIPKNHIRDVSGLDEKTGSHVMSVAKILASVIEKTFGFDGIEIRAVSGHFQDVPHFHLHVFGRNKINDIKIIYPKGINNSPEYLAKNAKKIKDELK
ncbi:MAG: HIT family protein [Candidatus Gracilibacteria bacterium]|jgi:diadenosine tetraphosphate (Ap4A) HIT family hydrolase